MKIRFRIEYFYFPYHREYRKPYYKVIVKAWLPKEEGYETIPYYFHGYLGDTYITDLTGEDDGRWRIIKETFISSESFEKAEKEAMDAIENYKKVVSENIKLKSKEKEIIADFPESGESAETAPKEKVKTLPTPPPKDDLPF